MLDRQPANSYVSSIIALALGIVLAVGVSAFFGLIGWGGEWASQVAGATSGAAPLIIDGIRQRRRRDPRDDLNALRRRRQIRPRLLIASIFGLPSCFWTASSGWSCTGSPEPRSTLPTVIKIGSSRHIPCWALLRHSRT
jgi:hypothetical protein